MKTDLATKDGQNTVDEEDLATKEGQTTVDEERTG